MPMITSSVKINTSISSFIFRFVIVGMLLSSTYFMSRNKEYIQNAQYKSCYSAKEIFTWNSCLLFLENFIGTAHRHNHKT